MRKNIRNVDVVGRKLKPVLIKTTNQRLEVAKKERQKREERVEMRETKTMTAKY